MTERTERSEGHEGMSKEGSDMTERTERSEGHEGMSKVGSDKNERSVTGVADVSFTHGSRFPRLGDEACRGRSDTG